MKPDFDYLRRVVKDGTFERMDPQQRAASLFSLLDALESAQALIRQQDEALRRQHEALEKLSAAARDQEKQVAEQHRLILRLNAEIKGEAPPKTH